MGLKVAATPLVATTLPGVMTPVPLAKTPVKATLDPTVIAVGFAEKLVMEGATGVTGFDELPPQPVKPATPRLRAMLSVARTKRRFMKFLVPESDSSHAPPCSICGVKLPANA